MSRRVNVVTAFGLAAYLIVPTLAEFVAGSDCCVNPLSWHNLHQWASLFDEPASVLEAGAMPSYGIFASGNAVPVPPGGWRIA